MHTVNAEQETEELQGEFIVQMSPKANNGNAHESWLAKAALLQLNSLAAVRRRIDFILP